MIYLPTSTRTCRARECRTTNKEVFANNLNYKSPLPKKRNKKSSGDNNYKRAKTPSWSPARRIYLNLLHLTVLSVNFGDEPNHFLAKLAYVFVASSDDTLNYFSRVFSPKFRYSLEPDLLGDY